MFSLAYLLLSHGYKIFKNQIIVNWGTSVYINIHSAILLVISARKEINGLLRQTTLRMNKR